MQLISCADPLDFKVMGIACRRCGVSGDMSRYGRGVRWDRSEALRWSDDNDNEGA